MSDGTVTIHCAARGARIDVQCDLQLADATRSMLSGLHDPEPSDGVTADVTFVLTREPRGDQLWNVRSGWDLLMACQQPSDALHGLMVFITQWLVRSRDDLLSVHAAAVSIEGKGVLLPASSGSGKTTLCARLVQRGAKYLSDDSIALDEDGAMFPYPKPLGFKWGVRDQFGDLDLADLELDGRRQLVWQVPPSRLGETAIGRTPVALVVVPRFTEGAELQLSSTLPHVAARDILAQAQNLPMIGLAGVLERVGSLVARCRTYTLSYGESLDAAPMLEDLASTGERGDLLRYVVIGAAEVVTIGARPLPAEGVIALCFDAGALLAGDGGNKVATIDRIGARIWPLLDGTRSAEDIARELSDDFEMTPQQIQADVSLWIEQLVAEGFLQRVTDELRP